MTKRLLYLQYKLSLQTPSDLRFRRFLIKYLHLPLVEIKLLHSLRVLRTLPPLYQSQPASLQHSAEFKFHRRQKHQSFLFWRSMHIFSCLPIKMHMQIQEVSTHSSSISRNVLLLADIVRTLLNVVGREIERKTEVRRRRQLLMTWYNLHTTLCKID